MFKYSYLPIQSLLLRRETMMLVGIYRFHFANLHAFYKIPNKKAFFCLICQQYD